MKANLLLIEDDNYLRGLQGRVLRDDGFEVYEADSLKAGLSILSRHLVHTVLLDGKLPDGNGVKMVAELKEKFPGTEIVVLTGHGSIQDGVEAIKNGAFDYLVKGTDNDRVITMLNKASDKAVLQHKILALHHKVEKQFGFDSIIGDSPLLNRAKDLARRVVNVNTAVLLLGETGTGKELFAQAIHYSGHKSQEPFIAVNCSALGRELLESELFGYKAGAFTGANKDKRGLFEMAHGGTIFLDEIGEISVDLQVKLLRVLENGTFIKIGDTRTTQVNCRIISATNRDLKAGIKEGIFREDLYYRLSAFTVELPALRDRIGDIRPLANFYINKLSSEMNKVVTEIDEGYFTRLEKYPWKGNVREFRNIIERSLIMCNSRLTADYLDLSFYSSNSEVMEDVEASHIKKILAKTNYNKTHAAKILGMPLSTLYRRLEYFNIKSIF